MASIDLDSSCAKYALLRFQSDIYTRIVDSLDTGYLVMYDYVDYHEDPSRILQGMNDE